MIRRDVLCLSLSFRDRLSMQITSPVITFVKNPEISSGVNFRRKIERDPLEGNRDVAFDFREEVT